MKFPFAYKLILFISVLILFLVAPLAAYFYIEVEEIVEYRVNDYMISLAEAVEGQVFLFFDKAKVRTSDWSSDGYIRQIADKIIKEHNQDDIKNLNTHLAERKLPLDQTVKITDVVDLDMRIIASSDSRRVSLIEYEHISPIKDELIKSEFGKVFIDGLKDETGEAGEYHPIGLFFHAMTPIKSVETGETIAVLLVHFTGDTLNDILSGAWQVEQGAKTGQEFIQRLETSQIYLVNEDKLMITPSRFMKDAVLKQKVDSLPVKNCFEKGEEFVGNYLDYRGVEVEGASMCFSDYKMALLVEVDSSEIFEDLNKEKNDFILVTALLWIFSVLTSILFSRFFLRSLKSIGETAKKISKGDFDVRADVKVKDEIGDLANVFNNMLDAVKQSRKDLEESNLELQKTQKELEEANLSLEEKIKTRTKELEEIKNTLELRVHEKTVELEKRLADLEKFRKLTLGRELRMVELKEEMDELKKKLENKS